MKSDIRPDLSSDRRRSQTAPTGALLTSCSIQLFFAMQHAAFKNATQPVGSWPVEILITSATSALSKIGLKVSHLCYLPRLTEIHPNELRLT